MMIIRICLVLVAGVLARARSADDLHTFLSDLTPGDFYEGANGFGALREDIPVAPVLKDGQTVAWAFLTSDFVGTTGYSGKPIHFVAAISTDAVLTGVESGGLSQPESDAPPRALDLSLTDVADWSFLSGDGSVRRLALDIGQINAAFAATGDARAIRRAEPGADDDTYIDMHAALASVPSIGRSLLGPKEHANLIDWLGEDEHAVMLVVRGRTFFQRVRLRARRLVCPDTADPGRQRSALD